MGAAFDKFLLNECDDVVQGSINHLIDDPAVWLAAECGSQRIHLNYSLHLHCLESFPPSLCNE